MYSQDTNVSYQSLLPGRLSSALAKSVEPLPVPTGGRIDRSKFNPVGDNSHSTSIGSFQYPDNDQKISQELLSVDTANDFIHENAFSAPTYDRVPTPPHWTESNTETSLSPAAMFLSAFSPIAPSASAPDSEGEVVSGWTLGSIIGHGGFSTVRRAFSPSGGTAAVKIVRRSDISKQSNPSLVRKRLSHEAAIWSSISHEHILPLFSVSHTSYADFFFTLYCPAGSLFDILKRDGRPALPHDDAGMMFRQVVRGLRYMHDVAGLVHRDMKLENVLVDEMGVCRIGDFGMTRNIGETDEELDEQQPCEEYQQPDHAVSGLSRRHAKPGLPIHLSLIRHHSGPRHRNSTPIPTSPSSSSTHLANVHAGSLPYAAPELLLPQTAGPLLPHPAQDIWALGVMLYTMLTGKLPFRDSFEPRLQMKILHGVYEVPSDIGRSAERVLRGCLDRSLLSRWTIAMVDEVAWGVGWGADADDAAVSSPEDEEEFEFIEHPTVQSGFDPAKAAHVDDNEDWKHDLNRPSIEASQRRSSSRNARSLFHAPALASRASTRSRSRAPNSTNVASALSNSILSTSSSLSSPSSSAPSLRDESALFISPSPSLERGRRPTKSRVLSTSRSPSPSVAPATPIDLTMEHPRFSESVDREISRGRRVYGRSVRTPRTEHFGSGDNELDVLDETERWNGDTVKGCSSAVGERVLDGLPSNDDTPLDRVSERLLVVDRDVWAEGKGRRAGSTPPAPSSWCAQTPVRHQEECTSSLRFTDSRGGSRPISIAASSARSRSVGCRRDS